MMDFAYSGVVRPGFELPAFLQPVISWADGILQELKASKMCDQSLPDNWSHVFANWYIAPTDRISAHTDESKQVERGTPVMSVSFGTSRLVKFYQPLGQGSRRELGMQFLGNDSFMLYEAARRTTVSYYILKHIDQCTCW
jgi:hypothetical protein